LRYVLQPTGADAVFSELVFLHLLERDTERIAKPLLGHLQHHSSHTHAGSDVPVDRVGLSFGLGGGFHQIIQAAGRFRPSAAL
jgi:hypothetical protein